MIVFFLVRLYTSIAMIEMVGKSEGKDQVSMSLCIGNDTTTDNATVRSGNNTFNQEVEFDWTDSEQGNVLSAYFVGLIIATLPAGILVDKIGERNLLTFGTFI